MQALAAQKVLETGVAAAVFATVFMAGGRLNPLSGVIKDQRSVLSLSSGIAVAYVFVHVLPELSGARETFIASTSLPTQFDGMVVYVFALVGFLFFYSLDHLSRVARQAAAEGKPVLDVNIKVGSFAAYVWLVSYLLVNNLENSPLASALYAVAMAVHFLTFDHAFRAEDGDSYRRRGQYILAAAALVGWLVGLLVALPRDVLALMLGFLSGGVLVNSAIVELPSDKGGRLVPFLAGSILYTMVLVPLG
jgi:hypothetical protein